MDRSDRSIQQTAGDGATQIAEVHGNVYIGGPAPEAEVSLDLNTYREHQLSQLAIWERQYTRLDVDPAVALAGQDLRPVPDSRLALTEAFLRHKRLVVVGGAGAGKTTSMLYLVASVLRRGSLTESMADFVPVYIELGRFRSDASTSPLDQLLVLITETLFLGKACSEPPSLRGVRHLLTSHRFILFLDGLNEAQAEFRESCFTAISDLARLYPNHRIVLSSRQHGFTPPQGWEIVLLRELDDGQISEFVERYSQNEVRQSILQIAAHNPLLRIPLFLDLAIKMGSSPQPVDQRRLRSRSGLVKAYVESLLFRGFSSSERVLSLDRLRTALDRLAQATQVTGQVLSLSEARLAVETDTPGQPIEAQRILGDLCERGFLTTDGQSVRFWHQTIQEYFYAGSIVRRWRRSKKQVGRIPWWLRRLAAKAEEEEALSFMMAHLNDEEAGNALHRGLRVNPALAIAWADELSLEGRASTAVEQFPAKIRHFAFRTVRVKREDLRMVLPGIGSVGLAIIIFSALVNLGFGNAFAGMVTFQSWLLMGIWWVACMDSYGGRASPVEVIEPALGAIPRTRDASLRRALSALAQQISYEKSFGSDIQELAQTVSVMRAVDSESLIKTLRASKKLYSTTRSIGYLDTPAAVPLLEELLKLNNFLSPAALEGLSIRATRRYSERSRVNNLLWNMWENEKVDLRIRRLARRLLLQAGANPGGRMFFAGYFLARSLKFWAVAFGLLALEIALPVAFFALWLISPILIWWDARRIGLPSTHPDGGPFTWAILAILFSFLAIPMYLLSRQDLRRDAAPIDWDALLQSIQTKEPHGDNLVVSLRDFSRAP